MSTANLSTSLLSSIPNLSGNNYYDWKFAVSHVLHLIGALNVVNGTEERPSTQEKAAEWDRLSKQGLTLYDTQQDPSTSIREYTSCILNTATRLRSISITLRDKDVVDVLIFNLHPDWSNVATSLFTVQGNLKIADVTSTLKDEESCRKLDPDPSLSALAASSYAPAPTRSKTPLEQITCYNCGKKGHYQQQCDQPKKLFRECAALTITAESSFRELGSAWTIYTATAALTTLLVGVCWLQAHNKWLR
ncbi:hypothetical protein NUW54_g45 [Trametes sanguinea]|uniref:Uncharacterized protein n=3 Tax=Trametes sanguinea TaxID=158606 RepID=A0ACC1PFV3_9APHY|nr:hypothetical protein NUW54_g8088 [Trametes sanguinea]KAJ3019233.1 hypothetical protein NUW54_g142 [Trametes sanguinea]KAJ3019579.1 hypothetical protein NUW54_g45 [Trametes sanguinea]